MASLKPNHDSTDRCGFAAGDVFACWGADGLSRAISLLTSWPIAPPTLRFSPSHVAIAVPVVSRDDAPNVWIESTTLSQQPCLIRGDVVSGAQAHSIPDRVREYCDAGGRVDVYRLSAIDALHDDEREHLRDMLLHFVSQGVGYDAAEALTSGLRVASVLRLFRGHLDRLFCSELIAAVLQRLCRLNRDNPARFNPGRLVRRLVDEGTYYRVGSFGPQSKCFTLRCQP